MADVISALNGRQDGVVQDAGPCGMITLRGDLSNRKLRKTCVALTQTAFPAQGQAVFANGHGLCWMSPDELLILLPYDAVATAQKKIAKALKRQHYLAENLSDARALIRLSGAVARDALSKLAPVDLHPDSFAAGDFRRTRLGQVAAAFWMQPDGSFLIVCFRSVADYAFDLLVANARDGRHGYFPQS